MSFRGNGVKGVREFLMKRKAFTLIELMIVVAIIGILAAIAIPKFAQLINKSKEGHTKGALATLRTAISVYYSDNECFFPTDDLKVLTKNAKYLAYIPDVRLPGTPHQDSRAITTAASGTAMVNDAGGWAYDSNKADHDWGRITVNCDHADISGNDWSRF